jgi:hypothetical protein
VSVFKRHHVYGVPASAKDDAAEFCPDRRQAAHRPQRRAANPEGSE